MTSAIQIRMVALQLRRLFALAIFATIAGCVSIPDREPVPAELTLQAGIPGVPDARTWADVWPKWSKEIFAKFTDADFRREFAAIYGKQAAFLAISGGGANGAFGAGLFSGWTAAGNRPEFAVVTGVSTGALPAPLVHPRSVHHNLRKTIATPTRTDDTAPNRKLHAALSTYSSATP